MDNCHLEQGEGGGGSGGIPLKIKGNSKSAPDSDDVKENETRPFIRALQLDLVAEKILSFINFKDIKNLCTVSTGCLTSVRQTKEFSERARLVVCKELISLGVLQESTYRWKNISINLSLPVEVVGLIEDMLPSVTSLSLRLPEQENAEMTTHLAKIFKGCTNLINLELDPVIMKYILLGVLSEVEVQNMLTKLESLSFLYQCSKPMSVCYIVDVEDSDTLFQRNFLQLSTLPLRLKKFVFGKVLPIYGSESAHVKLIPKIVDSTKSTLVDLELHLNVWKFEEMTEIRCPKLKRLTLSANGNERDAKVVRKFIKNQPPLEELTIEMNKEFPINVLQVIQGSTTKMKKLHLKGKKFSETSVPVDWSFLKRMDKLVDFFIRKPYSSGDCGLGVYGHGEDILRNLPDCTEKISLEGFDPFWKEPYPVPGNIGDLLSRFSNLKEISVMRSTNAITDEGLQTIITNCRKLTSLAFSHCPDVTDFGISGARQNEESAGVSLKDLKGLTCLKIRSCPHISSGCLLNVVQFSHLRFFDYYTNIQLPEEFLFQIARQNPCLEEVSLHITGDDQDTEYTHELQQKVTAINPRLHLIENFTQSNWEDEDSDSDASSIHRDGDSDISGGGYAFNDFDDFVDDYYDSPDEDEEDDFEF